MNGDGICERISVSGDRRKDPVLRDVVELDSVTRENDRMLQRQVRGERDEATERVGRLVDNRARRRIPRARQSQCLE